MLPKGIAQEPKRKLPISSHTKRERLFTWGGVHVTPEGRPEGTRRDGEQSYNPILPAKVENRRASVRSGHGIHWREGGNKQRIC